MLKNKTNLLISEKEMDLLEKINLDLATGAHLVNPRSDEYWKLQQEIYEAINAKEPTERQAQMLEYIKQCSDYFYWKTLPEEKKLFVEVDD